MGKKYAFTKAKLLILTINRDLNEYSSSLKIKNHRSHVAYVACSLTAAGS